MEEGSVDLTVTRVNMIGAPRAGKTCSLLLLLNEDPPTNDTSTPIACPAVRAIRVAVCNKTIWNRVTRANLLDQLATSLDAVSQEKKTKEPPLPIVLSLPDNTQPAIEIRPDSSTTPQSPPKKKRRTEVHVHVAPEYHTEAVVQEILATQPKGIHKSDHWLYVIDSGGQPAYQELLPLFTRAASLNIITLDLSKPFNERFDLMYRIDGQDFPCHSKSTQLAFFQSAVSTGASFKPLDISCISKKPTHSMHLVLGTHYDKVSDATCTLKEKNEILKSSMSSLKSHLQNCVIHQSDDDSIIFPVNTMAESEERAKYSEEICKAIWLDGSDASLEIKIPIRWFAFELSLPEQSIVSVKEALSIGERYSMKEEDTKQALRYFHDVSLMLYYPEVTNVVFIDTKPILEILSQLLALTYVNDRNARALILIKPVSQIVTNNLKEGFFNENIFEHLKSKSVVFSLPEFQLPHLIKLLLYLNIITELKDEQKGQYFIPYALPSYNEPILIKETIAKPLLIVWMEEKSEEILPVPTGLFPLTIVHLLNQKEYATKISPSTSEYYKFRNAMSLKIAFKGKEDTFHLINHYTHIEVYFTGPTEHCLLVHELITAAIDNSSNAMHLKHNYVNAFVCPTKRNSCYCIVRSNEDGNNIVNCTVCPVSATLSSDHWYWFESGPAESNNGTQISDQLSDENPLLYKKPEKDDLMKLFIDSAAHYMIIGIGLSVNVADLTPLPNLTITNLIQVFQRWSDSNNDFTWAKILKVCKNFPNQLGKAEADLKKFLSSPDARDKYLK
uniref:C-terminal of Roc (COR) domain-containing protein n=1 Tax=Amphimedon queenslandica TaxID=400682 RepID=A0A1X7UFM0_AMPQE